METKSLWKVLEICDLSFIMRRAANSINIYLSSSSQKFCKSYFEFFVFKFSSSNSSWSSGKRQSLKNSSLLPFLRSKPRPSNPRPRLRRNSFKTSFKTKAGLKTYVTAKYYLLFFFQIYSVSELELDLCLSSSSGIFTFRV